jgi:hypothetical protein
VPRNLDTYTHRHRGIGQTIVRHDGGTEAAFDWVWGAFDCVGSISRLCGETFTTESEQMCSHYSWKKVMGVPTSAAALMSGEPSIPTEKECNLPQPFTRVSPRS